MKKYQYSTLYLWHTKNTLWRLGFGLVWCAVLSAIMYSCDDFVAVDLPQSQLTTPAVFEDSGTATAAMTELYSKIRDGGLLTGSANGLSHLLGNYADELDFYGGSQNSAVPFYQNSLVATNPTVKELWNTTYNQIYGANALIEGLSNSTKLTVTVKDQLTGEALFVRALLHFYLANLYSDVPYITTTDYEQNRVAVRLTVAEVYQQAKVDLEQALLLLPEDYLSYDRVRPNVYAAHALLARINLYAGLWDEAANEASAVLNQTGLYSNDAPLAGTFLNDSNGTIWQLAAGFAGGNTLEVGTFSFEVGPPPLSALRTNFMAAFEVGDQRKDAWIGSVTDGSSTWYYPSKYKAGATGVSSEYSVVFRIAELYLIRAEARAHNGDLIGSREDLNIVRQKAVLLASTATTESELLTAILQERRVEFFTEFGHRFFDLKRYGLLQTTLSPLKPGWDATAILFPIPATELSLNPNLLPQNIGY
ncbi:RagB/SusD family nutrient uptake outer membrane protein [Flavobacterium sp.]